MGTAHANGTCTAVHRHLQGGRKVTEIVETIKGSKLPMWEVVVMPVASEVFDELQDIGFGAERLRLMLPGSSVIHILYDAAITVTHDGETMTLERVNDNLQVTWDDGT